MNTSITIFNYRPFGEQEPLRLDLSNPPIAIIGANNVGKSAALLLFYEFRPLFEALTNPETLFSAIAGLRQALTFPESVLDAEEVFNNQSSRPLRIVIELGGSANEESSPEPGVPFVTKLSIAISRPPLRGWTATAEWPHIQGTTSGTEKEIGRDGTFIVRKGRNVADLSQIISAARELQDSMYIGAFRNALNLESNNAYFDLSVGKGFIQDWRRFKTGRSKASNIAATRITRDIADLLRVDQLEINASDDMTSLQLVLNGRSYRLSELGAGISHLIITLASAAVRTPHWILLDEPELSLHAALQPRFMNALSSYSKRGILFATHNVGLARASGVSVYAIRQDESGFPTVREFERVKSMGVFLGELGYSGYRELGFDHILLVEGTTDRPAIQSLLRAYGKEHQFLVLPLGGSSLIGAHVDPVLAEIKRIAPRVSALVDSERKSAGEELDRSHQEFLAACEKNGVHLLVMERRALENYFSQSAITSALGAGYTQLAPFERLADSARPWRKLDNWRIARAMTREQLEHTDVGDFLAAL